MDSRPVILLVEDHAELRAIYRIALERSGFHVLEAPSGEVAMETAALHPIDALVTDVMMPGISGRELAWRITQRAPGIPVILVSAFLDRGNERNDPSVPIAAYVHKPAGPMALATTVRRVLQAE